MGKPPVTIALTWQGGMRFTATGDNVTFTIDGDHVAGPSPMQTLAASLAGCMAIDVVDILTRGRHEVTGFEAHLVGDRAATAPKRFLSFVLKYTLRGDVPAHAIERAIALSREKYCSVWHSLRQDIEFTTSYEVHP